MTIRYIGYKKKDKFEMLNAQDAVVNYLKIQNCASKEIIRNMQKNEDLIYR